MAKAERYFEFKGGSSNKFWSIRRRGASVSVRFGRIGTDGQEKTKESSSTAEAVLEAEKLVREKLGKGYKERSTSTGSRPGALSASKASKRRAAPEAEESAEADDDEEEEDDEGDDPDETLEERFKRLPAKPGKRKSFAELAKALGFKHRNPLEAKWRKEMSAVTGLDPLPPSYCEYLRHLRGASEWILAVRQRNFPYYINILDEPKRLADEREGLRSAFEMCGEQQPKVAAKHRALVPFATNASRTAICWDPKHVDRRGEAPIYEVDHSTGDLRVHLLGKDLLEVIQYYVQHSA